MSIARERFQVIDGVAGVVHEAASREGAMESIRHSHPTAVPRGVAFRVISR